MSQTTDDDGDETGTIKSLGVWTEDRLSNRFDEVTDDIKSLSGQIDELRTFVSQTVAKSENNEDKIEELKQEIKDVRSENKNLHTRLQNLEGSVSGYDPEDVDIDRVLEDIHNEDFIGRMTIAEAHELSGKFHDHGYVTDEIPISKIPSVSSSAPLEVKAAVASAVLVDKDNLTAFGIDDDVHQRISDEIIGCMDDTARKIARYMAENWGYTFDYCQKSKSPTWDGRETSTNTGITAVWLHGLDTPQKVSKLYDIVTEHGTKRSQKDVLFRDTAVLNDNWHNHYDRYPVEKASEADIEAFIEKREGKKSTIEKTDGWEYDEWVETRDGTYMTPSDLRSYLNTGDLPDNVDPL